MRDIDLNLNMNKRINFIYNADRYCFEQLLGDGGFGKVYLATLNKTKKVAIKLESLDRSMMHIEVHVLRLANKYKCKHFCEFLGQAIKELHSLGVISRDVKPGNFAPGHPSNNQKHVIYMYDFGLARRYVDENNTLIPPRCDTGWRGTARYGSLVAHMSQDLSRRDDLESWFYMLVEVTQGCLPWRSLPERKEVHKSKQAFRHKNRKASLSNCPRQYDMILTIIDGYSFGNAPDYNLISSLLKEAKNEAGIQEYGKWDWDPQD